MSSRFDDDYDECEGGSYCGGCSGCIRESDPTVRTVVARKPRYGVLPGDLVRVESGFTYQTNGPRQGYYKRESAVGYGPGHGKERVGTGSWGERFAKTHPSHVAFVEARDALYTEAQAVVGGEADLDAWETRVDAWEAENGTEWARVEFRRHSYSEHTNWSRDSVCEATAAADAKRAKREEDKRARERQQAFREAASTVEDGTVIDYRDEKWSVGDRFSAMHWFSSMEYNGELCDGECRIYRTLTNTETGDTQRVCVGR